MNVTIIGAGSVGTTIAILLHRKGFNISSVISGSITSARRLAKFINCRNYSTDVADVYPSSKYIIISTPEEKIGQITDAIAKKANINYKSLIAFHTSGSYTSDELLLLEKKGARVFSLHPVQTFPKEIQIAKQLIKMNGIYYGYEGKDENFKYAKEIVKSLNGRIVRIPKEGKILYHIACVFASNYSIILLGVVADLLKRIDEKLTLEFLEPLIKSSINNALHSTPQIALTGPIKRGSYTTIDSHLRKLNKIDADLSNLYRNLAKQALKMIESEKILEPNKIKKLKRVLKTNYKGKN